MKIEELEPGLDGIFHRLIPDLMNWQGASSGEVEKVEQIVRKISGHDLPKFYRWFLMRMGHDMGKFSDHDMDYTAATVLSWYGENFEDDGNKFFKIGHTSNVLVGLHMYYDFNFPLRDDARVTMRAAVGGEDYKQFETFREMLVTKAAHVNVLRFPVYCTGTLRDDADVLPQLDPVMNSLGFSKPGIPIGPRCGLYEASQATMVTTGSIEFGIKSCGFVLGGNDANILRNILGSIETETDFILDVRNDPRRLEEGKI